jgi:hypothetical protein
MSTALGSCQRVPFTLVMPALSYVSIYMVTTSAVAHGENGAPCTVAAGGKP